MEAERLSTYYKPLEKHIVRVIITTQNYTLRSL